MMNTLPQAKRASEKGARSWVPKVVIMSSHRCPASRARARQKVFKRVKALAEKAEDSGQQQRLGHDADQEWVMPGGGAGRPRAQAHEIVHVGQPGREQAQAVGRAVPRRSLAMRPARAPETRCVTGSLPGCVDGGGPMASRAVMPGPGPGGTGLTGADLPYHTGWGPPWPGVDREAADMFMKAPLRWRIAAHGSEDRAKRDGRPVPGVDAVIFDFGGVLAEEAFSRASGHCRASRHGPPGGLAETAVDVIRRGGYVEGRAPRPSYGKSCARAPAWANPTMPCAASCFLASCRAGSCSPGWTSCAPPGTRWPS